MPGPPPNEAISPSGAVDAYVNSFLHQLFRALVTLIGLLLLPDSITPRRTLKRPICARIGSPQESGTTVVSGAPKETTSQRPALLSLSFPNNHALEEPKSHTQLTQYGLNGSKFMVQTMWNLASQRCASIADRK